MKEVYKRIFNINYRELNNKVKEENYKNISYENYIDNKKIYLDKKKLLDKLNYFNIIIKLIVKDNIIELISKKTYETNIDDYNDKKYFNKLINLCCDYTIKYIREVYLKLYLKDYIKDNNIDMMINKDFFKDMIRTYFNLTYKEEQYINKDIKVYLNEYFQKIKSEYLFNITENDIIYENINTINDNSTTILKEFYYNINIICDNIHKSIINLNNCEEIIKILINNLDIKSSNNLNDYNLDDFFNINYS
jgi:hypothetical protein